MPLCAEQTQKRFRITPKTRILCFTPSVEHSGADIEVDGDAAYLVDCRPKPQLYSPIFTESVKLLPNGK